MARASDAAQSGPPDSELVQRYLSGDQRALGDIYERYADRVHDLCLAMLYSPDDAADAFQDTFLVAAQKLDGLDDHERLRPWLYSVARNQCRERIRARTRTSPQDDAGSDESVEIDMTAEVTRVELAELLADAKLGLNERDQEVLDLHMRHGLEGEDLAAVLDVSTESAYKLVQRVRSRVERSLGALLVARHGRSDCADLTELLADWDGRFSPLIRKRVGRHVDGCSTCSRRRKALLDPGGLAGAMPMRPAPATVFAVVLTQILAASPSTPSHEPAWQHDGFPASSQAAARPRALLLRTVAFGLIAALVTAGVLALDQEPVDEALPLDRTTTTDGIDQSTATSSETVAGVTVVAPTTAEPAATTTTTLAPAATTSSAAPTTTTTAPLPATTSIAPVPTTQAPSTTAAPTSTTTTTTTARPAEPSIDAFRASPTAIVENSRFTGAPCGPGLAEATLFVIASADVTRVEATWTVGTTTGPTPFTLDSNGRWTATFGPFSAGTFGLIGEDVVLTATAWVAETPSKPVDVTINISPC